MRGSAIEAGSAALVTVTEMAPRHAVAALAQLQLHERPDLEVALDLDDLPVDEAVSRNRQRGDREVAHGGVEADRNGDSVEGISVHAHDTRSFTTVERNAPGEGHVGRSCRFRPSSRP